MLQPQTHWRTNLPRKAQEIEMDTVELDTQVANDATASSAWVSVSELLIQILERQTEARVSSQPI